MSYLSTSTDAASDQKKCALLLRVCLAVWHLVAGVQPAQPSAACWKLAVPGSVSFCPLRCRPGLRLLLAAPTFGAVSAALVRRRDPARLLQRASQANKGRRSATGAAVRPPVPPRLGRTSSQAVGSFTSRRTCACCRWSFETRLAWQRPRRPICSRTIGPRCWQPFKRLSTGTSRWCRPETASPVHVVLVLLASR